MGKKTLKALFSLIQKFKGKSKRPSPCTVEDQDFGMTAPIHSKMVLVTGIYIQLGFDFCRVIIQIKKVKTWLQSVFLRFKKKKHLNIVVWGNRVQCVCPLFKQASLYIGIRASEDLICEQDPHVNAGEVKTLHGDFDLFAFTHVGSKGAYCGRPGVGSGEMSDNLSQWIESPQTCGPCISGQCSVKFTCCPQPTSHRHN